MLLRRLGALALAIIFLCLAMAGGAFAEEPPAEEGMTPSEVKGLSKALKARAKTWWSHRKRVATSCRECKGTGKVRWGGGRSGPLVACPKCKATKLYVDEKEFFFCEYEMRTPSFRLQEGVQDILIEELGLARRGRPFPEVLKKYTIKAVDLVDGAHGIVHVKKNKESVARPQRWVLATAAGEKPDWYLFDATVDGTWPGEEAAAPSTPDKPTPGEPTERPARPRPPPRAAPIPARREPARGPQDRDEVEASKELIAKWGEDRNDMTARVIRIQLGLAKVEGHEETVEQANVFLAEVKTWMDEVKPVYERAKREVEEDGLGVLLADRLKVNTKHFKAFRRLELTENMLIVLVPDLRDG